MENFCYASSGIVPLRQEPSDASEMLSQIILGETAKVLDQKGRWLHIQCDQDDYTGWVNRSQMQEFKRAPYEAWINDSRRERSENYTFFAKNEQAAVMIPSAAYVILEKDKVILPHDTFTVVGQFREIKKKDVIDTALQFLGVPYLWGGRTDNGIDCSGFIQTIHLLHGYHLPRDSRDQLKFGGIKSNDLKDAERGDLIYFNTTGERVNHVGLYLGDSGVIHASGNVRLSNINYDRRNNHLFSFDKRLADHIYGIQSGSLLRKLAKPVQIE